MAALKLKHPILKLYLTLQNEQIEVQNELKSKHYTNKVISVKEAIYAIKVRCSFFGYFVQIIKEDNP